MSEEREEVYQILELGKHEKNLHHKKGFGGLLFIDLSMIKFSKLSSYIRQLDKENQKYKEVIDKATNELFNLKDMIYKPETREENIDIQRKISSIIKKLNVKGVE